MKDEYALNRVENLVHRASERLWTAFDHYWPATNNNAIGEANILAAIAQELVAVSGLKAHMFMESPFEYENGDKNASQDDDKKYGRVDGVALFDDDAAGKFVGAFEAKRIFENSGAQSILEDINRLRNFGLEKGNNQIGDGHTVWHDSRVVNVVVAMTHYKAVSDWWEEAHDDRPQGSYHGNYWPEVKERLNELGGNGSGSIQGRRGVLDSGKDGGPGRYFESDVEGESDPKLLYLIYPQSLDQPE